MDVAFSQNVSFSDCLTRLLTRSAPQALVDYMHKVLDALEIRNGPSHGEIMWTKDGPCLVEVGSRPHGGEGTFVQLVEQPIGYSQLSVMIDAHENR